MPIVWYNDRGRILEVDGVLVSYKHATPPQADKSHNFPTLPLSDPILLATNHRVVDATKEFRDATHSEMIDVQIWVQVTLEYKARVEGDSVLNGLLGYLADENNLDRDRLGKRITTEMRGFSDV